MSEVVGLLVDVDFSTGRRAGNLKPDGKVACTFPDWQSQEQQREVYLVLDPESVALYEDIPGITILRGEEAVDAAVAGLQRQRPAPYAIGKDAMPLFLASMQQAGESLLGADKQERLVELHAKGILGIGRKRPRVPRKCAQMVAALTGRVSEARRLALKARAAAEDAP